MSPDIVPAVTLDSRGTRPLGPMMKKWRCEQARQRLAGHNNIEFLEAPVEHIPSMTHQWMRP
jgi:hypothetical protein